MFQLSISGHNEIIYIVLSENFGEWPRILYDYMWCGKKFQFVMHTCRLWYSIMGCDNCPRYTNLDIHPDNNYQSGSAACADNKHENKETKVKYSIFVLLFSPIICYFVPCITKQKTTFKRFFHLFWINRS